MKNFKFKLGLTLFILGALGILSLLTVAVSTENLPPEIMAQFSERELQWLSLINPLFLLILAVVFGTLLHDKVKLGAPTIEKAIRGERFSNILQAQLKYGLIGGIISGVLLILVEQAFLPLLSEELLALSANLQLTPLARFLYGGITEEILLRFGFMTILVWLLYRISKRLNAAVYWMGILLSSLLFAAAHLPVIFQAGGSPSSWLIFYILAANSLGGIIFGWLYWRKGLESSFIAHITTHIVFLIAMQVV